MGILSWWRGNNTTTKQQQQQHQAPPPPDPRHKTLKPDPNPAATEVPGMNGAVEVTRESPPEVTVFEFGSVAASADKVTLAGFCPVSDDLEPCRWAILPASDDHAPQFRIAF